MSSSFILTSSSAGVTWLIITTSGGDRNWERSCKMDRKVNGGGVGGIKGNDSRAQQDWK